MNETNSAVPLAWWERDEVALQVLGVLLKSANAWSVEEIVQKAYQYTDVIRRVRRLSEPGGCLMATCLCTQHADGSDVHPNTAITGVPAGDVR